VHGCTADADSDAHARWFYDGIAGKGVAWDITGLSYYCNWHGTMANMTSVVADVRSRYGKPVVIAETAAPFTLDNADRTGNSITSACSGYPATWNGQGAAFAAVQSAAKAGGAIGVFYWEPTWIAVPGNGWDPADIANSGDGWDNMAVFNWTGVFNGAMAWTS
jgi:arabinogalactan endo-1,4-beta-galactosidase